MCAWPAADIPSSSGASVGVRCRPRLYNVVIIMGSGVNKSPTPPVPATNTSQTPGTDINTDKLHSRMEAGTRVKSQHASVLPELILAAMFLENVLILSHQTCSNSVEDCELKALEQPLF